MERYVAKIKSSIKILLLIVFAGMLCSYSFICTAKAEVLLAKDGKAKAYIVLGTEAVLPEKTAASELAAYLGKITGGKFTIVDEAKAPKDGFRIYVGPTSIAKQQGINTAKLGSEEWIIRSIDNGLILTGGRPRGTLYAVYRFLEDALGVHWWNPWEETVPKHPTLEIPKLNRSGKPTFLYRDIHGVGAYADKGRFSTRNRLNYQGGDTRSIGEVISPEYGGDIPYGLPYHAHTLYMYIPPNEYFKKHPEWFSMISGKRSANRTQLCLTNQKLRDLMVSKLKDYIKASRKKAKAAGFPPPTVFSISQEDWANGCQCKKCQALIKATGAESGPLIDFLNYIADSIANEYPEIYIDTLAYHHTQKPPKNIKARDKVIVRMCDTLSNITKPVTHPDNATLKKCIQGWSKVTKHLRIWDYAVTFGDGDGLGLPKPTVYTYPIDFQFYAENGVEGVFTQHAHPVLDDMRDFKVWMMMKLLEDPYRDYKKLVRTFTDGFYGPAGKYIREYIRIREAASKAKPSFLTYSPEPRVLAYTDMDFMTKSHRVFDQAEQAVANDPVLLERVRHARLSLDRATILMFQRLVQEWLASGKSIKDMPFDRKIVAKRLLETWSTAIDKYFPADYSNYRKKEHLKLKEEAARIAKIIALPLGGRFPAKFQNRSANAYDFTADTANCWRNVVKLASDPKAESKITNRLEFWKRPAGKVPASEEYKYVKKYKLPMSWGVYDAKNKKYIKDSKIYAKDVPGPGYHWYNTGKNIKIGPGYLVYFFWHWVIQQPIGDAYNQFVPDQLFDVWARIKFEGPSFPYGKPGEKDAICVERVIVVKSKGK